MDTVYAKVCILLRPDEKTYKVIEEIVGFLTGKLTPVGKEVGDLPYHMTIIGGAQVKEDEDMKEVLHKIARKIKPFIGEGYLPKVADVEPIPLFGGAIAIRLKFKPDSFVISGNEQINKALKAILLSNQHFDFIRHITLYHVGNDYGLMDEKLNLLEILLHAYREQLVAMTFTPEIWIKHKESVGWEKMELMP